MRRICVLALAALATACSPALVVEDSKFAKAEDIQCRQQTTTGSHMSRRVCTTRAERERQTAEAREGLDNAMREQRSRALMDRAARRQSMSPRP